MNITGFDVKSSVELQWVVSVVRVHYNTSVHPRLIVPTETRTFSVRIRRSKKTGYITMVVIDQLTNFDEDAVTIYHGRKLPMAGRLKTDDAKIARMVPGRRPTCLHDRPFRVIFLERPVPPPAFRQSSVEQRRFFFFTKPLKFFLPVPYQQHLQSLQRSPCARQQQSQIF